YTTSCQRLRIRLLARLSTPQSTWRTSGRRSSELIISSQTSSPRITDMSGTRFQRLTLTRSSLRAQVFREFLNQIRIHQVVHIQRKSLTSLVQRSLSLEDGTTDTARF